MGLEETFTCLGEKEREREQPSQASLPYFLLHCDARLLLHFSCCLSWRGARDRVEEREESEYKCGGEEREPPHPHPDQTAVTLNSEKF